MLGVLWKCCIAVRCMITVVFLQMKTLLESRSQFNQVLIASEIILKWINPNKTGLFCKYIRKGSLMHQPMWEEREALGKKVQHGWMGRLSPSKCLCQSFLPEEYSNLLEPANFLQLIFVFTLFLFSPTPCTYFIMNFKDSSHTMFSVITTEASFWDRCCLCKGNLEFTKASTLWGAGCQSLSHLKPLWREL